MGRVWGRIVSDTAAGGKDEEWNDDTMIIYPGHGTCPKLHTYATLHTVLQAKASAAAEVKGKVEVLYKQVWEVKLGCRRTPPSPRAFSQLMPSTLSHNLCLTHFLPSVGRHPSGPREYPG